MKKFKILLGFLLFFSILGIEQCDHKPRTLGSIDRVIVLADSVIWNRVESDLKKAVERERFTPQPEKVLLTVHQKPKKIGALKRYPHLLFLGTLESDNETKQIVDQILTSDSRQRVENNQAFLFKKPDAWAKDQLLVAVITRDLATMEQRLQQDGKAIFNVINDHAKQLVKESLYFNYEQKKINKQLLQEHGWMVRVPHDYFLAVDSSEINSVWLRRVNPQRDLFVYWEKVDDPSLLSKEWMLDRRNWISENFYNNDFIYEDDLIKIEQETVDFNGRYAIQLDGVWQNEKLIAGGPFRSYGFYNKSDSRLYLIDLLVFRPGERKWPFMRQLEIIARTYKTEE